MDILSLKQGIYWGSWLVFPLLAYIAFGYYRGKRSAIEFGILLAVGLLFVWMCFVEPNLILVRETTMPSTGLQKRIAVISDLHLGLYKGEGFLRRVVARINELKPDLVLFAGDFSYHPEGLDRLYQPFADLRIPLYAVLGNHDVERPGPPIRAELVRVLEGYGVRLLQNQLVTLPDFILVGLGEHWAGEDDLRLLDSVPEAAEVLVLAHNPDTSLNYRNDKADFTISGHTHGGQVRIPWLYRKVIPTLGPFDRGLTREPHTQLFISSGLGEIALPLRLFNPPAIDLLTFAPRQRGN